jgi:hypothetical protein
VPPFQPSLFASGPTSFDASFAALARFHLDETSWIDHAPGWVSGSDALFVRVPKVRHAGPRISVVYRHGLDPRAYGGALKPPETPRRA